MFASARSPRIDVAALPGAKRVAGSNLLKSSIYGHILAFADAWLCALHRFFVRLPFAVSDLRARFGWHPGTGRMERLTIEIPFSGFGDSRWSEIMETIIGQGPELEYPLIGLADDAII